MEPELVSDPRVALADSMIEYFASFPDNILETVVFPKLPIAVLGNLCSSDQRFSNVCQSDTLWYHKLSNDYPEFVDGKSAEITWRDYYILVSSPQIPLYYHGDRIGYIPFNADKLSEILRLILTSIEPMLSITGKIAFINEQLEPVIIINYLPFEGFTIKVVADVGINITATAVVKAVIITNVDFDKEELPTLSGRRGRKPDPTKKRIIKLRPGQLTSKEIILNELTSIHGNPPIYGVSYGEDSIQYATVSFIKGTRLITHDEEAPFYIIDNSVPLIDPRMVRNAKRCSIHTRLELIDILQKLQVDPFINIDWSGYTREDLCNAIKSALTEIGHIL